MKKITFALVLLLAVFAGVASADTVFSGGSVHTGGNWDNGVPNATNPGTITVDGAFSANGGWGFGGATVTQTAGVLTGSGNGFNLNQGDTWNLQGGTILTRYFLANGSSTVVNLSGGAVTLGAYTTTQHMGVANNGKLNISGSVVIDGTEASTDVQSTSGTIDISGNWTGSWTWGTYTGTNWKDRVTTTNFRLNGSAIDSATFDSAFVVSNGGQTLEKVSTAFNVAGGNITTAGNWTNGAPSPTIFGTLAIDADLGGSDTWGFGNGSVVTQTAGALASANAERGFNFNGGGTWNLEGGSITARYVLANGSNEVFNFSGGTVTLSDATGTQHMGVANGGKMNISGSVVLDGMHATTDVQTGGTIDFATGWTGSWTWGFYSGTDWKDVITTTNFTLDGVDIDSALFDANFDVSANGQVLTMVPEPATMSLLALGGMAMLRRKRK